MNYRFKGNRELHYNSVVENLGKFILENPECFELLPEILQRSRNKPQVIDSLIEEALDRGSIHHETAREYKKLVSELLTKDQGNGNYIGKLVECIVAHIIPLTFAPVKVVKLKNCQIWDIEKCCYVGNDKNFDLGCYNQYDDFKDLEIELIECKTNIENFLFKFPKKQNHLELNHRAKEKLGYIKAVKDELKNCKHAVTALATISRPGKGITRSLKALKQNGFNSIIIFDYLAIRNALNRAQTIPSHTSQQGDAPSGLVSPKYSRIT